MGSIVYNVRRLMFSAESVGKYIVFESRYSSIVARAKGHLIVFYKPRNEGDLGYYFAIGKVGSFFSIRSSPNLLGAEVAEFEGFNRKVPYRTRGMYYESAMLGRNWRSVIQRTVRDIPDEEIVAILDDSVEGEGSLLGGFGEPSHGG